MRRERKKVAKDRERKQVVTEREKNVVRDRQPDRIVVTERERGREREEERKIFVSHIKRENTAAVQRDKDNGHQHKQGQSLIQKRVCERESGRKNTGC